MASKGSRTGSRRRSKTRRVLITGAAGSVGALAVEEALEAGWLVRATDRPGAAQPPEHANLEWVEADLTHADVFPALVEGVAAVVHTAAWVDIRVPFEAQAAINLHAVRHLYAAAEAANVSTLVHFSTGSLYAASDVPLVEEAPLMPTSGYELSKLLAEDFLRSRRGSGPVVNMLRPALIYGPRGRVLMNPMATVPVLLSRLDGWVPGLRGGPRTNMLHARDGARAALFLVEQPQEDCAVFNVAAPQAETMGAYIATVLRLGGVRPAGLELPFPRGLLRLAEPFISYHALFDATNAGLGWVWSWFRKHHGLDPGGLAPRVDMESLPYMAGDAVFDTSRLPALGFEYRYPDFAAGWQDSLDWYREHRWLPAQAA